MHFSVRFWTGTNGAFVISMEGRVFIAIGYVGKLTVKTALCEDGADERRNAS